MSIFQMTVARYQCASVNPDNHGANFCILRTIYVRKNLVAVDFSISDRGFFETYFRSEYVDKSEAKQKKQSKREYSKNRTRQSFVKFAHSHNNPPAEVGVPRQTMAAGS